MAGKVFFAGNRIGGDDAIGPILYDRLKQKIKGLKKYDIGVIGLDVISYIEPEDKIIIIDAVQSEKEPGNVVVLDEKDLEGDLGIVSQHDLGIEHTLKMIRSLYPKLPKVTIIGITIGKIKTFKDRLSRQLQDRMPDIEKDVLSAIRDIRTNELSDNK